MIFHQLSMHSRASINAGPHSGADAPSSRTASARLNHPAAEYLTGCTRMMLGSDVPLAVIMGNQGAPGQGEAPLELNGFNLCLPC